jgi:hypothetical protein
MTGRNESGGTPARRITGALAAAMVLVLGAQGAIGAPSDKAKSRQKAAQQASAPKPAETAKAKSPTATQGTVTRAIGNVTVTIDPATGKIRPPTAQEAQALAVQLQHMLSRETENLVVIQREDGTQMVGLDDSFQEVAMASIDVRGKIRLHCVNDPEQAMAILNGTIKRTDTVPYATSRAADKKAAVKAGREATEKE